MGSKLCKAWVEWRTSEWWEWGRDAWLGRARADADTRPHLQVNQPAFLSNHIWGALPRERPLKVETTCQASKNNCWLIFLLKIRFTYNGQKRPTFEVVVQNAVWASKGHWSEREGSSSIKSSQPSLFIWQKTSGASIITTITAAIFLVMAKPRCCFTFPADPLFDC